MARIRTIKPDFFQSDDVAELSYRSRLTWIGLWTYVDDAGRCKDNTRLIKGHVWPLEDDVTAKEVELDLVELASKGRIARYSVDGEKLIQIHKWKSHQRIAKPTPSRLPAIPGSDPDALPHHSDTPTALVANPSDTATSGKGKEVERNGKESDHGEPDTRTPEQRSTDDAYSRTGKAFNFIAVRGISKWALNERNETEESVADAIVAVYEAGKPITKSTIGQYLDGLTKDSPRRPPLHNPLWD